MKQDNDWKFRGRKWGFNRKGRCFVCGEMLDYYESKLNHKDHNVVACSVHIGQWFERDYFKDFYYYTDG